MRGFDWFICLLVGFVVCYVYPWLVWFGVLYTQVIDMIKAREFVGVGGGGIL